MYFHIIFRIVFRYGWLSLFTLIRKCLVIIRAISLPGSFPLLDPFHHILGRVEYTTSLFPTLVTTLRLPVVLNCTLFAKIMLALGNDGCCEYFPTQRTLCGKVVLN